MSLTTSAVRQADRFCPTLRSQRGVQAVDEAHRRCYASCKLPESLKCLARGIISFPVSYTILPLLRKLNRLQQRAPNARTLN